VSDASAHLPEGDRAAGEVLSLPMHPYLAAADIERISGALLKALDE
jgi:UDP-2-acetamido-2-deoxy-ribo-hexuluronate aminotransferase